MDIVVVQAAVGMMGLRAAAEEADIVVAGVPRWLVLRYGAEGAIHEGRRASARSRERV